jgi:hypothetical protein
MSISHGIRGPTSKAPLPGARVFWRTTFPVSCSEETDISSLSSNEDLFEELLLAFAADILCILFRAPWKGCGSA